MAYLYGTLKLGYLYFNIRNLIISHTQLIQEKKIGGQGKSCDIYSGVDRNKIIFWGRLVLRRCQMGEATFEH
jgi:hypothetical protein